MVELDHRSVCRKTGVSPEVEMDVVTRVELEYSYWAGDGQTRSRVVSMPKERSGRPRLDPSCDWEKYGYDRCLGSARGWRSVPSFVSGKMVTTGMWRVNNGMSTRHPGWLLADVGTQIKVDPSTINTVCVPFYWFALMTLLVPALRFWCLLRSWVTGMWSGVMETRWEIE